MGDMIAKVVVVVGGCSCCCRTVCDGIGRRGGAGGSDSSSADGVVHFLFTMKRGLIRLAHCAHCAAWLTRRRPATIPYCNAMRQPQPRVLIAQREADGSVR